MLIGMVVPSSVEAGVEGNVGFGGGDVPHVAGCGFWVVVVVVIVILGLVVELESVGLFVTAGLA